MQCPGDKNHRGIKIVLAPKGANHYANVLCKECGMWISNADAGQMEVAMSSVSDEVDEAREVKENEVERMVRCIHEAREITKECYPVGFDSDAILQIAFKLFDGRE